MAANTVSRGIRPGSSIFSCSLSTHVSSTPRRAASKELIIGSTKNLVVWYSTYDSSARGASRASSSPPIPPPSAASSVGPNARRSSLRRRTRGRRRSAYRTPKQQ